MSKFKEYLNKVIYTELEIVKKIDNESLNNKFTEVLNTNIDLHQLITPKGLDRNGVDYIPNLLADEFPNKISGYEDSLNYAYKNKDGYFFLREEGNNVGIYEITARNYNQEIYEYPLEVQEIMYDYFDKFISSDNRVAVHDLSFKKLGSSYKSIENLGSDLNVIMPKIVWIIRHHINNNTNKLYVIDALKKEVIIKDKKVHKSPRFYMYKKILKNLNVDFKECLEEYIIFSN